MLLYFTTFHDMLLYYTGRWVVLCNTLKEKNEQVDSVVPLSQDFDEMSHSLSDWLDATEVQLRGVSDVVVVDVVLVGQNVDILKVSL